MQNAASVLISPFNGIWQSLAAQGNAWSTIHKMIQQDIRLPNQLSEIDGTLRIDGVADSLGKLSGLISESLVMAEDATNLLSLQQQAIVYPGLVGAWAIVEAAFDDLILKIMVNDPNVVVKLLAAGVKTDSVHLAGTDAWAKELYKRVESNAKNKAKGYVVETHKASFSVFGVVLEYPADKARVIEELNQTRNCILHNQGAIDDKAAKFVLDLRLILAYRFLPLTQYFLRH